MYSIILDHKNNNQIPNRLLLFLPPLLNPLTQLIQIIKQLLYRPIKFVTFEASTVRQLSAHN